MTITNLRLPCQPDRTDRICTVLKGRNPIDTFDGKTNPSTRYVNVGTIGEDRPIYIQFHIPERPQVKNPNDFVLSLETTEALDINKCEGATFGPHWTVPLATYGFIPDGPNDWRLIIPEGEFTPDAGLLFLTLRPI